MVLALVPSLHITHSPSGMFSQGPHITGPFMLNAFQLTWLVFRKSFLAILFTCHDHKLSYLFLIYHVPASLEPKLLRVRPYLEQ